MHKRLRDNHGFTISELLIAIAVIGIIASISFVSYRAYLRNTLSAQAASTASAYQDAVHATIQQDKFTATDFAVITSCVSNTSDASICCILTNVAAGGVKTYTCTNNTTIGNFGYSLGYTASNVSAWVRSHLKVRLPPSPPANTAVAACTVPVTYTSTIGCSTREIGLLTYIMSDGSSKSYIHYYLPPDIDCKLKNVATVSTSVGGVIGVSYTNAKFTSRITSGATPFTFCMVGVT